jgi:hypothetical protein
LDLIFNVLLSFGSAVLKFSFPQTSAAVKLTSGDCLYWLRQRAHRHRRATERHSARAVFVFNVGVEIGQLMFVRVELGALACARRIGVPPPIARGALAALGLSWRFGFVGAAASTARRDRAGSRRIRYIGPRLSAPGRGQLIPSIDSGLNDSGEAL